MSDRMTPIPFSSLLNTLRSEYGASGTLFGGLPLIGTNPALRGALGWLFTWKFALLAGLLVLSLFLYRPFCRYLCPLGAIYALFNPVALYRFRIDAGRCTRCGACQRACKLSIPVYQIPNSTECIRCGDCRAVCPEDAISIRTLAARTSSET